MRHALRFFFAIPVLIVACSSSDDTKTAGPAGSKTVPIGDGPIAEADLPAAYAAAYCETLGPCCSKYAVPFDHDNCASLLTTRLQGVIANPARGTYDPTAAGQCIAAIRAVVTACDTSAIDKTAKFNAGNGAGAACASFYLSPASAPKPLGSACDLTEQCALQADGTEVTCNGTCRKLTHAADGDPCTGYQVTEGDIVGCNGDSVCTSGTNPNDYRCTAPLQRVGQECKDLTCDSKTLYCDADTSLCAARGKAGEPCTTIKPCVTGFLCKQSVCVALGNEGDTCQFNGDCTSAVCFQDKCFSAEMGINPASCADPGQ